MHIERIKSKQGKKVYTQILLRESYREPGAPRSAVKKRTLLNLTKYPAKDVQALQLALKYKNDLAKLQEILAGQIELKQGPSVGAVWVLYRLCQDIGLIKALGRSQNALLTLWMVMARLIDQGSRLSAVRLAHEHAGPEILGLSDFCEDDLYKAMDWLNRGQEQIEKRLFSLRPSQQKPELFFYDVTSSYLEGEQNELANYGYNRDKKRGKKQIVIGLLCDEKGEPVSIEVFEGNTADLSTFESQVALIKRNVIQLGLFDEELCEIEHGGVRYILRKNPIRADEMAKTRASKLAAVRDMAEKQNQYLAAHPRADVYRAWRLVSEKEDRLGLSDWVTVKAKDRRIIIEVDEEYLAEIAELLPDEAADMDTIHDRYKDLAQVERAFRNMKTGHLEVRPVFVRNAERTRAHVFIVMLAYRLRLVLEEAWRFLDIFPRPETAWPNCLKLWIYHHRKHYPGEKER